LPIRWRLTLFIALAIGAILLVLGVALFLLLRDALISNVQETAKNRAERAAEILRKEPLEKDDVEELTLDGVFMIVRDGNGNVVRDGKELLKSVSPPLGIVAEDTVWKKARRSDNPEGGTVKIPGDARCDASCYIYAKPVLPDRGDARFVEAGHSYKGAMEDVRDVVVALAAGIGVAFLLSIGAAYLLARTALRPVEAVTATAQEMGEGDLAKRLPVANPKDEIGRLTTTINGLLARLDAAFRRREETLSRQRRFAADASHELRTPLTSISGHARMLDEWALEGDKETAHRSLGTIRREAGKMRGLIEALLTLTRGDEGAPREVGRYDLGAVAKEATETAANGKVSIELVPTEHEITATFDRERVLQVASILLDNAVKYTPRGGSVTVRVGEEDGGVALAVSDTGVGIPEDQLPLVFERFYRADAARAEQGVGLGLSIARQIAEAHGGTIEARSEPGVGTTFVLLLPRQKPAPPQGSGRKPGEDPR
jgi:two-component system, OmpR family, sensor kinase